MSGMLDFISRAQQRKASSVFRFLALLQDMVPLNLESNSRCVLEFSMVCFLKRRKKHLPSFSECIQVKPTKSLLIVLIVVGNYFYQANSLAYAIKEAKTCSANPRKTKY